MFFINNLFKNRTSRSSNKGFTLVEMIVSMAIFTVVVLVAVGALLKVIDANKKAQSLKTAINNLNFALDSLSREMRVGTNYFCTGSTNIPSRLPAPQICPSVSTWVIAFYSSKEVEKSDGTKCHLVFAYWYDGDKLLKAEQKDCDTDLGENDFAPVTATNSAELSDIDFEVATIKVGVGNVGPAGNGKNLHSYAQFHFRGSVGLKEKTKSRFDFQTMVSQRLSD